VIRDFTNIQLVSEILSVDIGLLWKMGKPLDF